MFQDANANKIKGFLDLRRSSPAKARQCPPLETGKFFLFGIAQHSESSH
jgi:hypothetical protein